MISTLIIITLLLHPTSGQYAGKPRIDQMSTQERQDEGFCGMPGDPQYRVIDNEDSAGIWIADKDNGPDRRW